VGFVCGTRQELEAALSHMVRDLDALVLTGADAKTLVGFFSRLEHLAAAGKAMCALRVASTGAFELDGHRHAGEWLAAESGDSLGNAVSVLEAAQAVSKLPELEDAFRSGELSAAQAKEVAGAAMCDPASAAELIDTAKSEGFEALRRRCAELKAAMSSKQDQAARTRRIHAARRLRTWTEPDGTFRLDARLTQDAGARLLGGLKCEADKIFEEARRSGARESSQAYLADALVALATRPGKDGPHRPKALVHLRVDLQALRRGNTGPGEICEVAGVGPVSVATARELLGDSIAKVLVTSATDVHAICNLGRSVPARLYEALLERDRCCVVPGCSATHNLEIDHRVVPFAQGGPTKLANLARICHHHHFLKTHEGFSLEGEPGAWVWVHPDGSRHGPGAPPPQDGSSRPGTDPGTDARRASDRTPAHRGGPLSPTGQPAERAPRPRTEQASLFAGAGDRSGAGDLTGPGHAA
jgi:hypothetical protein